MPLTSKFEGVTITKNGIPKCKCGEEMLERVKKTAREPFTGDDKFWRCSRVNPRRDQCPSIIWFNEFDNVKPQLPPALEPVVPHTPKKKTQKHINGYLTPSTRGKPNESLKGNKLSDRVDDTFESKPASPSNNKRLATTTLEQTTPTKKSKMEAQITGSRSPEPIHRLTRGTRNASDKENLHPSSPYAREIQGIEGSEDRTIRLSVPKGCTEMCVTFSIANDSGDTSL